MKRRAISIFTAIVCVACLCMCIPTAHAVNVRQSSSPAGGGMSHSIALKRDGTVWTWGSNQQFQLGLDEEVTEISTPTQVEGVSSVVSVAAGYDFSVALRFDGRVFTWGNGINAPPRVTSGLSGVVAITAGQTDILALTIDGTVWQWTVGTRPKQVPLLDHISAISAGGTHYLALTVSGDVWSWGTNSSGQLGIGTVVNQDVPMKVDDLYNIIDIAAGYSHSLAVSMDGAVFSWGANSFGQLGDGTTDLSMSPVQVAQIKNATHVSAGNETSMALTKDGKLYTWGYGEYGQLAQANTLISQSTPKLVETSSDPAFLASGVYHNFFVNNDGDLYVWGRNRNKQLGTSQESNAMSPIKVLTLVASSEEYTTDGLKDASDWAKNELTDLYKLSIVPPIYWDMFTTNAIRAEFASLLASAYEQIKKTTVTYPESTSFTDIGNSIWEVNIRKAHQLEFIEGVSPYRFNPNGSITRQEAAKMICSFVAKMQNTPMPDKFQNLLFYSDASQIAEWAVPFVSYAYENDIMKGTGKRFDPLGNLTREQMLAMLYRIIVKYEWI